MRIKSRKLEFTNRQGKRLAARLDEPGGDVLGTALFAHCFTCSKDVAAAARIARRLAREGFRVLRFDFTGLGGSEGDFANTDFSSNVDDLVDAAGHLETEFGQGPELLVGHSLGGAAVLVAARRLESVRAVCTLGAPADPAHVKHLFSCSIEEIAERGEAEVDIAGRPFLVRREFLEDLDRQRLGEDLGALRTPLLVMHSPVDRTVGIENARELYESARGPRSFVSLDDADHLLTERRDAEYAAGVLAAWATRYVDGERATPMALPHGEVSVESRPPAKFEQLVRMGAHQLTADEPRSIEGDDLGPAPFELLLAALGTCTSMTLGMYARRKGWPLEGTHVGLRHEKRGEKGEDSVDVFDLTLRLDGPLDEEQRTRLLEIAHKCPVHRTLLGAKDMQLKLA